MGSKRICESPAGGAGSQGPSPRQGPRTPGTRSELKLQATMSNLAFTLLRIQTTHN